METIFVVPNEAKASVKGLVKIAKGSNRPALRQVQVKSTGGMVTMSATDSYVAARVRFPSDGSEGTWQLDADGLGKGLTGTGSRPVRAQLQRPSVLVESTLVELSNHLPFPDLDHVWKVPPAMDDGPHEFGFDAARMVTLLASVPKGARVGTVAHDLKPILMRASAGDVHWSGRIMPLKSVASHRERAAWVGGSADW